MACCLGAPLRVAKGAPVVVIVEYAAKGCTILGRRGFSEENNRGFVRKNKGDNFCVGWAVSDCFFEYFG